MIFRSGTGPLIGLICMAASALAEDQGVPVLTVPPLPSERREIRALLDTVVAAETKRDYVSAYALLRGIRGRSDCPTALIHPLDAHRNLLADVLATQALEQANLQKADGHWTYVERFYLQAMPYRADAAEALRQLWLDANPRAALGLDTITFHQRTLDSDDGLPGIRWRLSNLGTSRHQGGLDRDIDDLAHLRVLAGNEDSDLQRWTRQALSMVDTLAEPALPDPSHLAALAQLGTLIVGEGDPLVQRCHLKAERMDRRLQLRRLGPRVWDLEITLSAAPIRLTATATTSAQPTSSAGGFAPSSITSGGGHAGSGERLDVRLLREIVPGEHRWAPVWGADGHLSSFQSTLDMPVADADTGTASVNGTHYRSRLGLRTAGVALDGGCRLALGRPDGEWSLRLIGEVGIDAVQVSAGIHPVPGSQDNQTISTSALEPSLGLHADLLWQPTVVWTWVGGLGWEYLRVPSLSTSTPATFVNTAGTATSAGTVDHRLSGLHLTAWWLTLGLQRIW